MLNTVYSHGWFIAELDDCDHDHDLADDVRDDHDPLVDAGIDNDLSFTSSRPSSVQLARAQPSVDAAINHTSPHRQTRLAAATIWYAPCTPPIV